MAIEYLGNKTQLLDFIVGPIAAERKAVVADVFCGTASVSRALAERGVRVVANDHLQLCAVLAEAALLPAVEPAFAGLSGELPSKRSEPPYRSVLRLLNGLEPRSGFFHETYSPASHRSGVRRMYLTEENAAKTDAIRARIREWEPILSRAERAILLRDLVQGVSAVSNTAGTYGCYLKTWKRRALDPLQLRPTALSPLKTAGHRVHCGDATEVLADVDVDLVYLDPPYTKRQYAAYYHLLETLVRDDRPAVTGSTGLPEWQARQSDFCYRRRAPAALAKLIEHVNASGVFLSYSEDGHIEHDEILEILGSRGTVTWTEQSLPRYRSNTLAHRGNKVRERLYHLDISSRVAQPGRLSRSSHTRTLRHPTSRAPH